MNRLPSPHVLQIFIRNRTLAGWPPRRIATAIRTRLKLDSIAPDALDSEQRARYDKTVALLKDLEATTPS